MVDLCLDRLGAKIGVVEIDQLATFFVGERRVQPYAEPRSLSAQSARIGRRGHRRHQARARHDAELVELDDRAIDSAACPEVVSVDD